MTFHTRVSDFQMQTAAIRDVRTDVFVREQAIPFELEYDENDLTCTHAVAYDGLKPVATGRLDFQQQGRIGRVAVLESYRRRGLGTLIMQALEKEARAGNLTQIWFHAQVSAVPFYLSLGYAVVGDEFMEADIPHVSMEKQLVQPL